MEEAFLDARELAEKLSISPRTLRNYVADPDDPLPAFKVRGKLLFRPSLVKEWIERHRVDARCVDELVDQALWSMKEHGER